jgi:putative ABC transport system permease protein
MQTLWQDLRYGARMLWKKPGFTLIAVFTLALGIGANTAIFSVVNRLLLNPLPYKDGQRLVFLWQTTPQFGSFQLSPTDELVEQWRREATSYEGIQAFSNREYTLTGGAEPEAISVGLASTQLFSFLGVTPLRGRTFVADDVSARVIVLSQGLWQRRFGADPKILGSELILNDENYTVIGVLPAGFRLLGFGNEQAWLPLPPAPTQPGALPRAINAIARLKPGVTVAQAQAELNLLAARAEKENPKNRGSVGKVMTPQAFLSPTVRDALPILVGAVGLVLLIACANLANLLLARNAARTQEMAIRLAFGAGRWRLIRQLLVESLLLSLLGGLAGLVLASWGLDLIVAFRPDTVPQLQDLSLERSLLLFSLGLSLVTSLLFGLFPALQAARTDLNSALKQGTRTGGVTRGQTFVRAALVVTEVALSLVLLIGAGLLTRSFARLQKVELGFNPERLLTLRFELPESRYRNQADVLDFHRQLLARTRQLPGVQAAEVASGFPLKMGVYAGKFEIEGRTLPAEAPSPHFGGSIVGPNHFSTLGIPLRQGRFFTEQDTAQASPVVIINEALARQYWPGTDPTGQHFRLNAKSEWATIVGVVGNVKGGSLEQDMLPLQIYYANTQSPTSAFFLVVRASQSQSPASLIALLKNQLQSLDAKLPIKEIKLAEEVVSEAGSRRRFSLLLMTIFAGIAALLTAVGLYGLMSYLVGQRTREIGIRMALGAQSRDVLKLVVGQGLALAVMGVVIGLVAAFALTRLMASLLFGVGATDPLTFGSIALLLTLVALLACCIPARRATKVDPLISLRYE